MWVKKLVLLLLEDYLPIHLKGKGQLPMGKNVLCRKWQPILPSHQSLRLRAGAALIGMKTLGLVCPGSCLHFRTKQDHIGLLFNLGKAAPRLASEGVLFPSAEILVPAEILWANYNTEANSNQSLLVLLLCLMDS